MNHEEVLVRKKIENTKTISHYVEVKNNTLNNELVSLYNDSNQMKKEVQRGNMYLRGE